MAKRHTIHLTATTKASPETVFNILAESARWPQWSGVGTAALEREGDPAPDGLGARRVFKSGRITSREEVVVFEPGRQFSYILLSGLPVSDYRADVMLEPDSSGTGITWHSEFSAKYFGSGWINRLLLARFIKKLVSGLVQESDARATSG